MTPPSSSGRDLSREGIHLTVKYAENRYWPFDNRRD